SSAGPRRRRARRRCGWCAPPTRRAGPSSAPAKNRFTTKARRAQRRENQKAEKGRKPSSAFWFSLCPSCLCGEPLLRLRLGAGLLGVQDAGQLRLLAGGEVGVDDPLSRRLVQFLGRQVVLLAQLLDRRVGQPQEALDLRLDRPLDGAVGQPA